MNDVTTDEGTAAWLREFERAKGRRPRVLHIGNIANNAYNNAKLLNRAGLDCDVICHDYYHIMSCPEWEDAEFVNAPQDHFRPDWAGAGLLDFERPRWFAQGPLGLCVEYLVARREKRAGAASSLWRRLADYNQAGCSPKGGSRLSTRLEAGISRLGAYLWTVAMDGDVWGKLWRKIRRYVPGRGLPGDAAAGLAFAVLAPAVWLARCALRPIYGRKHERADRVVALFKKIFPDRRDSLTRNEVLEHSATVGWWRKLLPHYDIVQAYSTNPVIPMLAGKRPYVAFEHGTLRGFTLADDPVSRLNALAYNQAGHVFITNGDCLDYARRIGVTRYTAIPHPVDEVTIRSLRPTAPDLHTELGVRHVFLCTLRHDWSVKGTDKYIRALPGIVKSIGGDFVLLMTKWGAEVDASMQLAEQLDVSRKIKWIEPLPKRALGRMQNSVDILFDQIALPHFGGTAPEGIAAGVPVIMSYDPSSTEWMIPEPAPILPAWTVEEIVQQVCTALDPRWLEGYRKRAAEWFDRFHSSSIVVKRHMEVYGSLLGYGLNGAIGAKTEAGS